MAHFDPEKREIVVRIVYDGLAHAGKTANLRSLHATFSRRSKDGLCIPAETETGRTLYFDWLELSVGQLDDWPLRCQILTVPGQFVFAPRRYRLLTGIDGVVLVCDSTPRGVESARIASAFLAETLGKGKVPIVHQANKQDLPDALPPAEIAGRLDLTDADLVTPASASTGDGVARTFLALLDLVRERLRLQLRDAPAEALPPPIAGAEQLHAQLLAEEGHEDDRAATALDAALRAMHRD